MLRTRLTDGEGSGFELGVDDRHAAKITVPDRLGQNVIKQVDDFAVVNTEGCGDFSVYVTGIWSGTLIPEGSLDGNQWFPIFLIAAGPTLLVESTITANGAWISPCSALKYIRIRASVLTSGKAVVLLQASIGSSVVRSVSNLIGRDRDGNAHELLVDSSGAINVTYSAMSESLPLIVNLNYEISDGAIVANQYKRINEYTVPDGYDGWLIRFSSFQDESAKSRFVAVKELGTLNFSTNVFTAGEYYLPPQFSSVVECFVTTQTSSSGSGTNVTLTYTNHLGNSGRTGSVFIPKSSIVGTRLKVILQSGDIGIQSIQNIVDDSPYTGEIKIIGNIQLVYHNDLSNTIQLETNYPPGAIAFPSGTILAMEFSGSLVYKNRLFDLLIQLTKK